MRLLSIALLLFFTSVAAFSQSKPILRATAEMRIDDPDDHIITEQLLPNENKLLLVTQKSIRVWDLVTAKQVASRPIDVPDITEDQPRVISPNGRYMFVFGNYDAHDKRNKIKQPPSVWDLETGKQIAVFDKTKRPIAYAAWSKNGKTLVTSSIRIDREHILAYPTEISFWDGENFQYLSTISADNIEWTYLSADGSKLFYMLTHVQNFIILKFLKDSGAPINVWDIRTGKVEQTIFANANDQAQRLRAISISPDERFLTYFTQRPKSKDVETTLVVLSLDKTGSTYATSRKFEIKPTPKISDDGSAEFSPDEKYLALVTGKMGYWSGIGGLVVQLYSTETGSKMAELSKEDAPSYWLNDNQILLFDHGLRMDAFEFPSGRRLYQSKLIYKASQITKTHRRQNSRGMSERYTEYTGEWIVHDETKIVPHVSGRIFLTYSNQYVKVYDAQTGAVLQTLVEPTIDTSKPVDSINKPRLAKGPLVSQAEWSSDGNAVYIVSADKKSVSFWSMN